MQRSRGTCPLRGPRKEVRAPTMMGSPAALRKSCGSLRLDPVQASGHIKERWGFSANLPTLPKYLQIGPHFRTLEKEFGVTPGREQRKRSTPKFAAAADQEGEGSRDSAAKPRCSAFYTAHTNSPPPQSYHCDTRDLGTGRSDEPCR